jgi:hypothetical protein
MAFIGKQEGVSGGPHGPNHYVYWVPARVLNQLPIKRWKYNRPPDEERVAEIKAYMETSNRMDGIVYLAQLEDELVCYESNHRREALKSMTDVSRMNYILVDVLTNATHETIRDEFNRLNKSIPLPVIYKVTDTEINREELKEFVDNFCATYKACRSSSDNPHRPHFNRDLLTDEFTRILNETGMSITELMERLTRLNQSMMTRDRSRLPTKVIEKCEKTGLWLFAWSSKLSLD